MSGLGPVHSMDQFTSFTPDESSSSEVDPDSEPEGEPDPNEFAEWLALLDSDSSECSSGESDEELFCYPCEDAEQPLCPPYPIEILRLKSATISTVCLLYTSPSPRDS